MNINEAAFLPLNQFESNKGTRPYTFKLFIIRFYILLFNCALFFQQGAAFHLPAAWYTEEEDFSCRHGRILRYLSVSMRPFAAAGNSVRWLLRSGMPIHSIRQTSIRLDTTRPEVFLLPDSDAGHLRGTR